MIDRFPFYKQLDAMDCGATCLRMVAKHYGRHYSLEYLREITHLDREGVSLMGIGDAAESIGIQTLGVKIGYKRLTEDLPLPCIAHWRQQHFVVVYKADKSNVWVADPAAGKFKLSVKEFEDGWVSDVVDDEPQGILLLLEPTPEFNLKEGIKTDKASFKYVFSYLFKYKKLIMQLGLGLLIGSLLQLVFPFLMQSVVDIGLTTKDLNFIHVVLLAQFVLFFSRLSVEYIRGWILLHIGTRINISMVSDFLHKMMRLPIKFFDTKMTGDLLQRIGDNSRVEHFLTSEVLTSLFSMFNLVVFGTVLAYYNLQIFTIFFVAAVIYFAWISFFLKKSRELDYKRFDQMSSNQSSMIELISGMSEIKLHNAEKQKRWQWEGIQAKLFNISIEYLAVEQYQRAGSSFINESKNILITFVAVKAVMDGQMTLGMMLSVQYMIGQLNGPLEHLVGFVQEAQKAKISLERMNEIHNREDEEISSEKISILPENGDLRFDNVSFRYGSVHTPQVINKVNFTIPEGKTTAIVGTSGSGKTTILKLLLNFYQATEGNVKVGDVKLSNILNRLWRSKCGVVMQDGFIFTDTIAKNISVGDERVDKAKLLYAVKIANIQSFVESLPLGYNTKIGGDGMGLSQGQKQRLLIARAVYKNPDYIFLDEATNSLDAYNEMIIMDNLNEFMKNRTVVVVAHRLSTVKNADNIIVLEKGEIIEQGNHNQLTAMRGAYYHLVKNQLELGN